MRLCVEGVKGINLLFREGYVRLLGCLKIAAAPRAIVDDHGCSLFPDCVAQKDRPDFVRKTPVQAVDLKAIERFGSAMFLELSAA